ncbi:MAG: NAD(+)/NADH kinase [Planctomycetia bacterium]|nr:NAD(+)/NADH kinase [Planctomycetia bacterium]
MIDLRPGIAVVTRKTRMEGLLERWATRPAAKFRLVQSHVAQLMRSGTADQKSAAVAAEEDYEDLDLEDVVYHDTLSQLRTQLDFDVPIQFVDRSFLPNLDFGRFMVAVVVGQDGLVANTAKYVGNVPIVAVNPDPSRFDGVLLPFQLAQARAAVARVLDQKARFRPVTLAEVNLEDGQRLLAFNDLFVGCRSHVSARYRLQADRERSETQSSSGMIVATGAGSTGWLSSVFNMAGGIARSLGAEPKPPPTMSWEDRRLAWAVREPFVSKMSSAELVFGMLEEGDELVVESQMPSGGVIFSDGVEADFLEFNGGSIARISVSEQRARLVVP